MPSLSDSPAKTLLQKYRIAIAAAFAKLVSVIRHDQSNLQAWTGHARILLVEASDAYVAAAAGSSRAQKPGIGDQIVKQSGRGVLSQLVKPSSRLSCMLEAHDK